MTTPSDTGSRRPGARKSIGLWGAPQSGKTTFLAALYLAVTRSPLDLNIYGTDSESTDFLIQNHHKLSVDRRFPGATEQVVSYGWVMNVNADRPSPGQPGEAPGVAQFGIDLQDAPGRIHENQSGPQESRLDLGAQSPPAGQAAGQDLDVQEIMMNYLAECNGLLLLIDPVREQLSHDAHEYFQGTLLRIAQRRLSAGPGSKLPHYVAVCITKFDHPQVYEFARKGFYCTSDQRDPGFPRVHGRDAEEFFTELCKSTEVSDADLICNALGRFFHQDRIRYFVTSAIGFNTNRGRFQEDDYENTERQSDGSVMIRGKVHPINVLEPILWLGRNVAADQ